MRKTINTSKCNSLISKTATSQHGDTTYGHRTGHKQWFYVSGTRSKSNKCDHVKYMETQHMNTGFQVTRDTIQFTHYLPAKLNLLEHGATGVPASNTTRCYWCAC